jgi:hypothetical protein
MHICETDFDFITDFCGINPVIAFVLKVLRCQVVAFVHQSLVAMCRVLRMDVQCMLETPFLSYALALCSEMQWNHLHSIRCPVFFYGISIIYI